MKELSRFFIILITFTLAACGGGGGGGSTLPPVAKTAAVIKISTNELPPASGVKFTGVGVTLTLPKGVTVATDISSVATASGVAQGRSISGPVYTPAANPTIYLVVNALSNGDSAPFGIGEFVTVNLILPAGNSLTESDFTAEKIVSKWEPANSDLAAVPGVLPRIDITLN